MQFLKKHYEKLLLGVVLLGLTLGLGALPVFISSKKATLNDLRNAALDTTKVKPVDPLVITNLDADLQRTEKAMLWNYTKDHNLVNPVKWQKVPPDMHLVKGEIKKLGPEELEITSITPLYLRFMFDAVSPGGGYLIGFTNEAALKSVARSGERRAVKEEKNDLFILHTVTGAPDKPTDLELEMVDGGATVHVAPGKPYERVEGYEVELKYPPENNKLFRKKRRDDTLNIAGEDYKIVVITASNVVVSASQNKKKTTITYNKQ